MTPQTPRIFFFPRFDHLVASLPTGIHRRDFAIDSSRSIDTALAPPPSCPLFQGSPSANALAARELLVTSPTYRHACTHSRTRARIARARALAHAYTCKRNTHADGAPGRMVKGKSVRGRMCVGYFCFHFHQALVSRTRPNLLSRPPPLPPSLLPAPSSPSPSPIGAFSTTSSHVLEYEMRAAIFPPPHRRSTRFYDFTRSSDDIRRPDEREGVHPQK